VLHPQQRRHHRFGSEAAMSDAPDRFPAGRFDVFADDDDVIGLCVATTRPSGYCIIRTHPVFMDSFDEYEVARFLATCLEYHDQIEDWFPKENR
jgi:hypothetical protein